MKMLKMITISAMTFLLGSSLAFAELTLHQTIDKHNNVLAEAIMQGDIERLSDSHAYTDDAYVYAPSTPTVHGKENIREFWEGVIQAGAKHVSLEIHDVHNSGELAYAVGTLRFVDTSGQASDSRYLLVFKKDGEQWKLHLDMWTPSVTSK
ncbi:YybH family protein [Pseudoteredinibacter isoporae]|uniref:YybH family protein n=1 Tax=Pseudoteredinibacter isoporae TaxID=570281 RepID=UPI00310A34B3